MQCERVYSLNYNYSVVVWFALLHYLDFWPTSPKSGETSVVVTE